MSESEDSGPGRREVAYRLFAAEFDDAEFSYSESDEERAPNYVVTPTGARVNRIFAVGVLTELEQVNEEVLRARIVDPTGPFVVYAGQYQPEALAFLEAAQPPMFVAITGKARTFEPDDSDRVFTSIRPESISEVDAETRDRWVVQAAEQTIDRVGRMASAKHADLSGEALQSALVAAGVDESNAAGITLALDYYGTTGDYLSDVRNLAVNCARVVAGERDEAGTLSLSPGDGADEPIPSLATMALESPDTEPETTDTSAEEAVVADDGGDTEPSSAGSVADDEQTASSGPAVGTDADAADVTTTTGTDGESVEPSTTTKTGGESAEPSTTTGTDGESVEATPTSAETDSPATTEPPGDDVSASADADTSGTLGDFDSGDDTAPSEDGTAAGDDDVGEFDSEFELDEDEREEIEEEYGTDFQSGTEVDDAGEADIETPDPEELAEQEAAAAEAESEAGGGVDDTTASPTATDESSTADAESTDASAEPADATSADAATDDAVESTDEAAPERTPAEDVNLEDAVMDAMQELDEGSGANREELLATVTERHGADREAVEEAIQDALMGGRCYEPDDDKLTPI